MKSIINSINNRELAFLIWLFLIALIGMSKAFVRKSVTNLFLIVFWSRLTIYFVAVAVYTAVMIYFLWLLDLWDISQLKNTILWFLTAGSASLFEINKKEKSNYLRETIKDILSITAVLQFLVGIYSFSLAVELFFVPLIFLIVGMAVVAERNIEYHQLARILRRILVLVGLFMICYTLFRIIIDFKSFASKGTLSDFLIPAALSLTFLPMLYLLALTIAYENLITAVDPEIKASRLRRYAIWKALFSFRANKGDLDRWRRLLFIKPIQAKDDVDRSIEWIKEMKRKEKQSLPVEWGLGLSPYLAMKFLQNTGITTGYYQPSVDETDWIACSNYLEIDDNIPASTISYYVEGNADVATKLILNLTVYVGNCKIRSNRPPVFAGN